MPEPEKLFWRASTNNSAFGRDYRITVRSLNKRKNYCSCPDYAGNQLGTCKYIEAALHKIRKHPKYKYCKDVFAPFPYVFLAWDHDKAPLICLNRLPEMAEELQNFLANFFAAYGTFKARMSDDFFRFVEWADLRGDIHIGDDALDWAKHQARARAIGLTQADSIPRDLLFYQSSDNWIASPCSLRTVTLPNCATSIFDLDIRSS